MYNSADSVPQQDVSSLKRRGKKRTIGSIVTEGGIRGLSAILDGVINFTHKSVKPYLAGTDWETPVGDNYSRGVHAHLDKEGPFIERHEEVKYRYKEGNKAGEPVGKEYTRYEPKKKHLIDNQGFLKNRQGKSIKRPRTAADQMPGPKDNPDTVINRAKDFPRKTERYAHAKTNALLTAREGELNDSLRGTFGEDEAKARKGFIRGLKSETGEGVRGTKGDQFRAVHQGEMSNLRSHIKHDALEGSAILKAHKKLYGKETFKFPNAFKGDKRESTIRSYKKSKMPDIVRSGRENLALLEEHHVQTHLKKHGDAMEYLHKTIGDALQKRRTEGLPPQDWENETFKHNQDIINRSNPGKGIKYSPSQLHDEVTKWIDPLTKQTHRTLDIEKHYGHLGELLGKKPAVIRGIHQHLGNLMAETSEGGRAAARKNFIQSGAIFDEGILAKAKGITSEAGEPLRTNLKKFPLLRNTGLGIAAAGAAGIGISAYRKHKQKQEEKKLSTIGELIRFAAFNSPEMRRVISKGRSPIITKEAERLIAKAKRPTTFAQALASKHGVVPTASAELPEHVREYQKWARSAGVSEENINSRIAKGTINEEAAEDFQRPVFEEGDYHRRQQRVKSVAERDEAHGYDPKSAKNGPVEEGYDPAIEEAVQRRNKAKRSSKESETAKRHGREVSKLQGLLNQSKQTADFRGRRLIEIRKAGENSIANMALARQTGYDEANTRAGEAIRGVNSEWQGKYANQKSTHDAAMKKSKRKIAAGTAAGIGTGIAVGRVSNRKKKEGVKMNSIGQNIIRFGAPKTISEWARDYETLPLAGGIAAADVISSIATKDKDQTVGQAARKGLKSGAIYGGALVAAQPLIGRALRMSSRSKPIYFAAMKPSVAQDRYRKLIHEKEQNRAERNYDRSAIGGAVVGAMLNKRLGLTRGRAAIAGGIAGIGTQALLRATTRGTKDNFGERSYGAKRIEKLPYQAAGITAATLGIKAIHGRMKNMNVGQIAKKVLLSSKGRVIQFTDTSWSDSLMPARRSKEEIAIDKLHEVSKRGGRLFRDIHAQIKGEKVLDKRGREKTKEWERPWVKKALTGAIITGTGAALMGVHKVAGAEFQGEVRRALNLHKAGAYRSMVHEKLSNKLPGYKRVSDKLGSLKKQASEEIGSLISRSPGLKKINDAAQDHLKRKMALKAAVPGHSEVVQNPGGSDLVIRHGTPDYLKRVEESQGSIAARAEAEGIQANKKAVTSIANKAKEKPRQFNAVTIGTIAFRTKEYNDKWEGWLRTRPGAKERKERADKGLDKRKEEFKKEMWHRAQLGGALTIGAGLGMTALNPRRVSKEVEFPVEKLIKHAFSRR